MMDKNSFNQNYYTYSGSLSDDKLSVDYDLRSGYLTIDIYTKNINPQTATALDVFHLTINDSNDKIPLPLITATDLNNFSIAYYRLVIGSVAGANKGHLFIRKIKLSYTAETSSNLGDYYITTANFPLEI